MTEMRQLLDNNLTKVSGGISVEPTINQSRNTTLKKNDDRESIKKSTSRDNMEMKSKWRCPQTLKISESIKDLYNVDDKE